MRLLPARAVSTVSSPIRRGQQPPSLVASAERITRQNDEQVRRLIQAWQTRALSFYDQCGEIKFAAQFYARMLTPLELYVAEKTIDKDGRVQLEPTKNKVAVEQLDRIQDPGGGRSGLLGQYGRLMFLTGEGYLLCSLDSDGVEQWEILSSDELRIQGSTYLRYESPSLPVVEYKEAAANPNGLQQGEAVAIRIWQRHPRWSALADSTMFGVLDIVDELLILTRAVRARAKSRLAGPGALFIDDKIAPKPLEAIGDEDPLSDPLIAEFVQAAQMAIQDEGSASAVVPIIIRVPVPDEKKLEDLVYHLQVLDPTQLYPEEGLRMECIRRIAIGLDMPPEVLLGSGDVSHWQAWLVDEQTWKSHGQQKAQQFCDDISASFLRPTLRELRVPDWERYCIAYDAAAVINHPSRSNDAKELYDRRAIGKAALREANAFDEADAPTREELLEMIGVAIRDGALALFGTPSVRGGTVEVGDGELEKSNGTTGPTDDASAVKPGPPDEPSSDEQPVSLIGSARGERVLGAAHSALWRSREIAGSRIRSHLNRDKASRAELRGVPAHRVAAHLGRERVEALGCLPDSELVASAGDHLAGVLTGWGLDAQAIARLAQMVEKHAVLTLYEENPRPFPKPFTSFVDGLTAVNAKEK